MMWAKKSCLLAIGTQKGNLVLYDHINARYNMYIRLTEISHKIFHCIKLSLFNCSELQNLDEYLFWESTKNAFHAAHGR